MATFREISKEVGKELEEVNYIGYCLYTVAQMHIFHWLTDNSQEHEAIEEFYKKLQEKLDSFVERFVGKYDGLIEDSEDFTLIFRYDEDIIQEILDGLDDLTSEVIDEFDGTDDASIIDSLVDIKELVDNLRYKLRLE